MATISIPVSETKLEVINAYAKITKATVESLISSVGVDNTYSNALRYQIQKYLETGVIPADVKEAILSDRYTVEQALYRMISSENMPSSISDDLIRSAG